MEKKKNIITNLIWRFAERCGAQGVTFVVSIVLARLLDPEVYGTVALVTVFTTILQVFVDGGFGSALVQKKDADDTDFSTVFFFNLSICSLLYILIFFTAPLIASFYNRSELVNIVRVASIIIIISGVKNIQQAYVSRNLLFKKFFFATLGGTIGAAVIGIYMAYRGYGVWALVVQMLFNAFVDTIILWITVKWRPVMVFSFERLKQLFTFGWKMLIANLIATFDNQIQQLVIGKKYSSKDLAFFNKGKQFPHFIVENINTSIDSVLFPVLSDKQDDIVSVKNMTRKSIIISTYIMAPLMMGLAACAEQLVLLLFTEKWLPAVPFLRVFCVTYMFYPIQTANLNAIKATGRSGVLLKLQIAKSTIAILLLLISMRFGPMAIACSMLVCSFTSQLINSYPNGRFLDYSYWKQLKDILPIIGLSVLMGAFVWCLSLLRIHVAIVLVLQVLSGGIIYILLSKCFMQDSYEYCLGLLRSIVKK